jgi:hypothetical protein
MSLAGTDRPFTALRRFRPLSEVFAPWRGQRATFASSRKIVLRRPRALTLLPSQHSTTGETIVRSRLHMRHTTSVAQSGPYQLHLLDNFGRPPFAASGNDLQFALRLSVLWLKRTRPIVTKRDR